MRDVLRLLPASLLLVEALATGVRLAGLLPTLVVYGPVALSVLALRGLVGAMQFTGGWLLVGRRPPAVPIARAACLASAVLTTLETGFRLGPSNADPSLRWWLVLAYWAYALALARGTGYFSTDPGQEGTGGRRMKRRPPSPKRPDLWKSTPSP